MNKKIRRLLIAMIVTAGAVSCTLYEYTTMEEIHPPQVEIDSIIIPDWDNTTQQ